MRVRTSLKLLFCVWIAIKVQCYEDDKCPRKELPPGVLALTAGREVVLRCRGDVIMDGELLTPAAGTNQRINIRVTRAPSGPYQGDTRDNITAGPYQSEIRIGSPNDTKINISPTDKGKTVTAGEMTKNATEDQTTAFPNRLYEHKDDTTITMETSNMLLMDDDDHDDYDDDDDDYQYEKAGHRVTRGIKRPARWTFNGKPVREGVEKGALKLPHLQLSHTGNYSCYRGERLVSSVRISVGVPPEKPSVSCYRRSHTSKIRCDWISSQPLIPKPECKLLLRKGHLGEKFSSVPCSYSVSRSRCWCVLPPLEEGDRTQHAAMLCVSNTVGNVTSPYLTFTPQNIIKPDPPSRVKVSAVQGQNHALLVSWSYPSTWRQGFYYLNFQMKYHPQHSEKYQTVETGIIYQSVWKIEDAVPHVQYVVQLRAKDEFDGHWSEWSEPVYAETWTAPEPTIPSDFEISPDPFWIYSEGSGMPQDIEGSGITVDQVGSKGSGHGLIWFPGIWMFTSCLIVAVSLLSIYTLRRRVRLLLKLGKLSSVCPCTPSVPPPPPQQPADEGKSLMSREGLELSQKNSHCEEGGEEEAIEVIHLHNMGYFLS
ncbi:interleukin-6 receptor subunit alpha [Chanos chanos]|uniref:Interleukin-6 receptor subunit alpha n=1 Tax=Chanos chanos TaxID=29144 RepID=A0A6J2W5D8_CHACN|nr:interleukin-6 receptor subunit alpha [Chanos chanos]